MKFVLPKPPSVNHLYRFTCRRGYPQAYIDARGKAWFEECGLLIRAALRRKEPIDEACAVDLTIFYKRDVDIDNLLKATLDLLEKAGVLENDRLITTLTVTKAPVARGESEHVELEVLPI